MSKINDIEYWGCKHIGDRALHTLLHKSLCITELNLSHIKMKLTSQSIALLLSTCHTLLRIDLSGNKELDDSLFVIFFEKKKKNKSYGIDNNSMMRGNSTNIDSNDNRRRVMNNNNNMYIDIDNNVNLVISHLQLSSLSTAATINSDINSRRVSVSVSNNQLLTPTPQTPPIGGIEMITNSLTQRNSLNMTI